MGKYHILIVEGDQTVSTQLNNFFVKEHFLVSTTRDYQLALQIMPNPNFEHGITQVRFSWNSRSVSSGLGFGSLSVKLVDSVSASERVALANSLALNWVNSLL